jgi:hypothetical protein
VLGLVPRAAVRVCGAGGAGLAVCVFLFMKRYPKVRCICVTCLKLRIVTPLYETTKAEREAMSRTYVCSDCTPKPPVK